jgi:hypothetical protein
MSETFSVQLTAVATVALAVLALVAGVLAGLALRKQSQEVGLLLEQNRRDTDERRRAQAARVFLAAPSDQAPPVRPRARNASDFPVYDTKFWYADPGGDLSAPEHLGTIMPGDISSAHHRFSAQAFKYTALTFRDAAGIHWVRWPDGALQEVSREPESGAELSGIRRVYEVMEREYRNAAAYP